MFCKFFILFSLIKCCFLTNAYTIGMEAGQINLLIHLGIRENFTVSFTMFFLNRQIGDFFYMVYNDHSSFNQQLLIRYYHDLLTIEGNIKMYTLKLDKNIFSGDRVFVTIYGSDCPAISFNNGTSFPLGCFNESIPYLQNYPWLNIGIGEGKIGLGNTRMDPTDPQLSKVCVEGISVNREKYSYPISIKGDITESSNCRGKSIDDDPSTTAPSTVNKATPNNSTPKYIDTTNGGIFVPHWIMIIIIVIMALVIFVMAVIIVYLLWRLTRPWNINARQRLSSHINRLRRTRQRIKRDQTNVHEEEAQPLTYTESQSNKNGSHIITQAAEPTLELVSVHTNVVSKERINGD